MMERAEAKPETVLEVVCAWCGKDLGRKAGHGATGVSHGMCPECLGDWKLKAIAKEAA